MPAPTLDGNVSHAQGGGGANSVTLTTTHTNDIIVISSYAEATGSGTAPGASSVAGGGLTWARLTQANVAVSGCLEIWWALAATALSAVTLTVTYNAGADGTAITAFGVNGCNLAAPWDTNVGLPAQTHWGGSVTPSFTISTAQANDFLLFATGVNGTLSGVGTQPAGWTMLGSVGANCPGLFVSAGIAGLGVTSAQSSQTYTWGSALPASNNAGEAVFAALTADSAGGGGSQARAVVMA